MKKRNILILIAVIVLLSLAVSGIVFYCVQSFYSPGVHTFGNTIHYEVFDSAYIVGSDSQTTNLTFCGTYDGKAYSGGCGSFCGAIEVADYPVPYSAANGFITNDGRGILFTQRTDDYITANYSSTAIDSEGYAVPSGYKYTVVLNPDAPEQIIIVIYGEDGSPVAAVVNGSNQEESDQIYHDYIESIE